MTFCEMYNLNGGCGICPNRQTCQNSSCRIVEDYPNIGEDFLNMAADDIREINGQKKKQNRA